MPIFKKYFIEARIAIENCHWESPLQPDKVNQGQRRKSGTMLQFPSSLFSLSLLRK